MMTDSVAQWWQTRGNTAQWTSAVASSLALVVAFVAVIGAYKQIEGVRRNTREAGAKQIWRSYLELGFNNPQFAFPDYAQIKNDENLQFKRYRYFVGQLLYGCEEVLASLPSDRGWNRACHNELENHRAYLCEYVKDNFFEEFEPKMQLFLLAVINEGKAVEPSIIECQTR
jgi:hypothetical protein